MKKCSKCKVERLDTEFETSPRKTGGLNSKCRICCLTNKRYRQKNWEKIAASQKKWSKNNPGVSASGAKRWRAANPGYTKRLLKDNPEYYYAYSLKRFGLTVEEYLVCVTKQGGVCAICKKRGAQRLCVDHNHQTGKVRALLCHNCNLAIGNIKESPALARQIAKYLEKHL